MICLTDVDKAESFKAPNAGKVKKARLPAVDVFIKFLRFILII